MWVEQKYISGQPIDYTDANSILLSEFFMLFDSSYANAFDKAVETCRSDSR